jgi:hypothetical protein
VNDHGTGRPVDGEPRLASRALLILLGLLGLVLAPAIGTPLAAAHAGQGPAQQVSSGKTQAPASSRSSRGDRAAGRAALADIEAQPAPVSARSTSGQAHGPAPALPPREAAPPAPPDPAAGPQGLISGIGRMPVNDPRGRAPPHSTGF